MGAAHSGGQAVTAYDVGGIRSWLTARRVPRRYGGSGVALLAEGSCSSFTVHLDPLVNGSWRP